MCADLVGMSDLYPDGGPVFQLGKPFAPFEQLMAVLPGDSSGALPDGYRWLMTEDSSPIIDFYPRDFDVDLEGIKFSWQGVALLPFIDEARLLEALEPVKATLTPEEVARNSLGDTLIFLHVDHPFGPTVLSLYKEEESGVSFCL